MIDPTFAMTYLAWGGGVLDASFIFLGIAAAGWLGFWCNHRRQAHAEWELKWMIGLTVYAVLASCFGQSFGLFLPFLIGLEAFGVTPVLANTFSQAAVSFMTAFHSSGSPHPEFSGVRQARKVGRIDEAINLALPELEKDPGHYEGNYLLAEIYWERREINAAFFCLARILDNPQCTAEQRRRMMETVAVTVTDANGVQTQASQSLMVDVVPISRPGGSAKNLKIVGVIDWGTESPYDPAWEPGIAPAGQQE
jgi:hypothetical protein